MLDGHTTATLRSPDVLTTLVDICSFPLLLPIYITNHSLAHHHAVMSTSEALQQAARELHSQHSIFNGLAEHDSFDKATSPWYTDTPANY